MKSKKLPVPKTNLKLISNNKNIHQAVQLLNKYQKVGIFIKQNLIFVTICVLSIGVGWWSISTYSKPQASNQINVDSSSSSQFKDFHTHTHNISSVLYSNVDISFPVSLFTPSLKLKLPILMYHHIDFNNKTTDKIRAGLSVSPIVFEKQMQWIKANNYTTVNSFQVQDYLDGKKPLPINPILLTFDDGYKDNYTNAFPILQKYNLVGDFGIITSVIDKNDAYMSWDNLKDMIKNNMSVSSHTVNHCTTAIRNPNDVNKFLDSPVDSKQKPCSAFSINEKLTTGQVKYEFEQSKKVLEENLNIKVTHLIYPFGFYNSQAMDIAKEVGYKFATTVHPQYNLETNLESPLSLDRFRVNGQQDGELQGFFKK